MHISSYFGLGIYLPLHISFYFSLGMYPLLHISSSFSHGIYVPLYISSYFSLRIYLPLYISSSFGHGIYADGEIKKHGNIQENAVVFIVEVYNFECGSLILFHFLGTESHCIQMHLLDHRHQTIRTGGREVFFQSDLLDEI